MSKLAIDGRLSGARDGYTRYGDVHEQRCIATCLSLFQPLCAHACKLEETSATDHVNYIATCYSKMSAVVCAHAPYVHYLHTPQLMLKEVKYTLY